MLLLMPQIDWPDETIEFHGQGRAFEGSLRGGTDFARGVIDGIDDFNSRYHMSGFHMQCTLVQANGVGPASIGKS